MTETTTHPDYDRIHDAIEHGDKLCTEAHTKDPDVAARATAKDHVDFETLQRVIEERGQIILSQVPEFMLVVAPAAVVEAAWADAFLTGVRFQQMGGHVDG